MREVSQGKYNMRAVLAECACAGFVFVFSLSTYLAVASTRDDPLEHPYFLQTNLLYPAVFFAAGHGMGTADIDKIPGLDDFIYKRTMSFDIGNIPEDIEVTSLDTVFEVTHLYFLYGMGWLWRIFGVSAWVGALYGGLMRAFCALATYGLFRVSLGRIISLGGTLLISIAPFMVDSAIELRDFGKAPFILGFVLAAVFLVYRKHRPAVLLLLAAALGALLGIGYGFRQDTLACLPPLVATILLFTHPRSSYVWFTRFAALTLFLMVALLTAYPIIQGVAAEGGQAPLHAFFHGISPESEARIQFGGASYDSFISVDPAAYGIVNVYARRKGHLESMVNKGSSEYRRTQGDRNAPLLRDPYVYFTGAEYGRYATQVVKEYAWMYPADLASRAWRSVFSLHHIPLQMCDDMEHSAKDKPQWLAALIQFHRLVSCHLSQFGLFYCIAVLTMISARSLGLALYFSALMAWFAGYPTLWYEIRHLFFLAFIPLWVMILFWGWCIRGFRVFCKNEEQRSLGGLLLNYRSWIKPLGKVICFWAILLITVVLPVLLLRLWQMHQVYGLAERLGETRLEDVEVSSKAFEEKVFISPVEPLPQLAASINLPAGETGWEYVAAVFDTHGQDIMVTIHYDDAQLIYNFSQDLCVYGINDDQEGRVTLFFPIYEVFMNYGGELMASEILKTFPDAAALINDPRPIAEQAWWKRGCFSGISFPEKFSSAFKGFYRARAIDTLSLLPIFQLPEDRHFLRPYKTGPWERSLRRMPPLPAIYSNKQN